ncbi:MAG: hypothetical protein MZV64_18410 [Ignavibacteriales bacterium]|nr:hypothetical protein [Ignavibacteriales bacterium]
MTPPADADTIAPKRSGHELPQAHPERHPARAAPSTSATTSGPSRTGSG